MLRLTLLLLVLLPATLFAQMSEQMRQEKLANALQTENGGTMWGRDSTGHMPNRKVPWGQFMV